MTGWEGGRQISKGRLQGWVWPSVMVHIPIYWNKFSWEILINSFVNFVCPCQLCLPRYVSFFSLSPVLSILRCDSPAPPRSPVYANFLLWICWFLLLLPPPHSQQSNGWTGLGCIILLLKLHPPRPGFTARQSNPARHLEAQAWKPDWFAPRTKFTPWKHGTEIPRL